MDIENIKKQLISLLGATKNNEVQNLTPVTIHPFLKKQQDEIYQKMNIETSILTNGEVNDFKSYYSQYKLGQLIPLSDKLQELYLIYDMLSKIL